MAVNIWPNADLEAGITEWSQVGGATLSHSSEQAWEQTYSLKIIPGGSYNEAQSDVFTGISPSTQYTASWYFKTNSATQIWDMKVRDQDGNTLKQEIGNTFTADTWVRIDLTFTTGADDTGIRLMARSGSNNIADSAGWLDAVMLETGASASEWTNYVEADVNVTPPSLAMSLQIYDPVVSVSTPWDIGPYIYTTSSGGVSVNPSLLQTTIQIHDPVVYAVDVPTAITPNLMETTIQMLNPTVNVGKFRNRICSMLHLIMGR